MYFVYISIVIFSFTKKLKFLCTSISSYLENWLYVLILLMYLIIISFWYFSYNFFFSQFTFYIYDNSWGILFDYFSVQFSYLTLFGAFIDFFKDYFGQFHCTCYITHCFNLFIISAIFLYVLNFAISTEPVYSVSGRLFLMLMS